MYLGILLSSGLAIESWQKGFEAAKEMGYTHVELAANDVKGKGSKPDMGKCADSAQAAEVVNLARTKGLEVSAFQCHQGFLFDAPDKVERSVARALAEAGFDGVLSLELGHGISDQERLARENVPYLRRVLEEVGG